MIQMVTTALACVVKSARAGNLSVEIAAGIKDAMSTTGVVMRRGIFIHTAVRAMAVTRIAYRKTLL